MRHFQTFYTIRRPGVGVFRRYWWFLCSSKNASGSPNFNSPSPKSKPAVWILGFWIWDFWCLILDSVLEFGLGVGLFISEWLELNTYCADIWICATMSGGTIFVPPYATIPTSVHLEATVSVCLSCMSCILGLNTVDQNSLPNGFCLQTGHMPGCLDSDLPIKSTLNSEDMNSQRMQFQIYVSLSKSMCFTICISL